MIHRLIFTLALLAAIPARAEDTPKQSFTLTVEEATTVAQWATERRALAQQQFQQADAILAELQKQAAKPPEKK